MADLTPEARAQIAERVAAATPGPWTRGDTNFADEPALCGIVRRERGELPDYIAKIEPDGPNPEADADLIAHAPDDLAALLAHADAADAEIAGLRARLEAVAEARAGLVEQAAKAAGRESAALTEGQHGAADIHALIAGTYEIAAVLLGKALEGA